MAKLVLLSASLAGVSHALGEGWATVGRADGNTIQIIESSVSGRHCEVRVSGDTLIVRDLLSTNGTFVGGEKISEAVVQAGQLLRLGDVELRFEASGPAARSAPPFTSRMLVTTATADPAGAPPGPAAAEPVPAAEGVAGPPKQHHVMFVDDSMAFLELFGGLCAEFAKGTWQIHTTTTADRALAVLQESPVDLVVLDVNMPMLDGLQLLGIINRRHPGVKLAVMTGNASESRRTDALANGADLFIEKPVSPADIRVVFNMLNDLVAWAHREGFSGALRSVGLQEVLQMECLGRHSSILEIRNSEIRGQIYLEAGAITHAAVGTLVGEPALHRLLSVKGGEFQVKPFKAPPQRTINNRWEFLLMDAARAADEDTVLLHRPPPTGKDTVVNPPADPPQPHGDHPAIGEEVVVVATYDGKWNQTNIPPK
jgi:CheY-like chemotaxis protein